VVVAVIPIIPAMGGAVGRKMVAQDWSLNKKKRKKSKILPEK
jgi:hypothetical protein